jgi:hypothetical protein
MPAGRAFHGELTRPPSVAGGSRICAEHQPLGREFHVEQRTPTSTPDGLCSWNRRVFHVEHRCVQKRGRLAGIPGLRAYRGGQGST